MKITVREYSRAWRALTVFFPFIFLGFACPNDTVNPRSEKRPGPPVLDTLYLFTRSDTEACMIVDFTDTNTLEVSFNAYRTTGDGSFFLPVEEGRGIPENYVIDSIVLDSLNRPRDTIYTLRFKDAKLFQGLTLQHEFETFQYYFRAVSRTDSVSDPSNVLSFDLEQPAEIDSMPLSQGYPWVYYRLGGQMGTRWRVEITHQDQILASNLHDEEFGFLVRNDAFTSLRVDSLKAKAQNEGFNGVYGVRIFSAVGKAQGIAVSSFDVLP